MQIDSRFITILDSNLGNILLGSLFNGHSLKNHYVYEISMSLGVPFIKELGASWIPTDFLGKDESLYQDKVCWAWDIDQIYKKLSTKLVLTHDEYFTKVSETSAYTDILARFVVKDGLMIGFLNKNQDFFKNQTTYQIVNILNERVIQNLGESCVSLNETSSPQYACSLSNVWYSLPMLPAQLPCYMLTKAEYCPAPQKKGLRHDVKLHSYFADAVNHYTHVHKTKEYVGTCVLEKEMYSNMLEFAMAVNEEGVIHCPVFVYYTSTFHFCDDANAEYRTNHPWVAFFMGIDDLSYGIRAESKEKLMTLLEYGSDIAKLEDIKLYSFN